MYAIGLVHSLRHIVGNYLRYIVIYIWHMFEIHILMMLWNMFEAYLSIW
jgi:hypothetical protein